MFFCFECPPHFQLQLQREGTYQKKFDVKTFLFSSSNMETQRCNGQKSHLSNLRLFCPKNSYKNIILEIEGHYNGKPSRFKNCCRWGNTGNSEYCPYSPVFNTWLHCKISECILKWKNLNKTDTGLTIATYAYNSLIRT